MQIAIDIPEEKYNQIINFYQKSKVRPKDYEIAIINGTPLPKGHGRLIDESQIKKCGWNYIEHHAKTDAPTIIEADKE